MSSACGSSKDIVAGACGGAATKKRPCVDAMSVCFGSVVAANAFVGNLSRRQRFLHARGLLICRVQNEMESACVQSKIANMILPRQGVEVDTDRHRFVYLDSWMQVWDILDLTHHPR